MLLIWYTCVLVSLPMKTTTLYTKGWENGLKRGWIQVRSSQTTEPRSLSQLAVSSAGGSLGAQGRLDGFNGEIEGGGHSGYANNGNGRERALNGCYGRRALFPLLQCLQDVPLAVTATHFARFTGRRPRLPRKGLVQPTC